MQIRRVLLADYDVLEGVRTASWLLRHSAKRSCHVHVVCNIHLNAAVSQLCSAAASVNVNVNNLLIRCLQAQMRKSPCIEHEC